MFKKIIKESIILILLLVAILLVLGVLFYDYIPTGKVVPVIEQYQTSEDIKKEINQAVNPENSEIIVTYEIDNTDLKTYERTNDYDKGKENPFGDYSAQTDENTVNNSTNNTNNSINNTNTTNNNVGNGNKNQNSNSNTVTKNNSDGTFFNSTKTK